MSRLGGDLRQLAEADFDPVLAHRRAPPRSTHASDCCRPAPGAPAWSARAEEGTAAGHDKVAAVMTTDVVRVPATVPDPGARHGVADDRPRRL
ncbi:hypothetical protein OG802_34200 [Streptomyces sp. NBC_00704]|uniref:hypothetical protein n=1 Tax=Streptomyces sp. NBC_00704 TaxID=2975809 RepID=UPI002E35A304|nr:hypothetical protein [Streptomyces sp. NBC_00704]